MKKEFNDNKNILNIQLAEYKNKNINMKKEKEIIINNNKKDIKKFKEDKKFFKDK